MTTVHVKNMVCARCIKSVMGIFIKAGAAVNTIGLGVVSLHRELDEEQITAIKKGLEEEGFEWLDDQKVKLAEQVKREILLLVQYGELDELKVNLSDHLAAKLNKDYHYISNIFSAVTNTTIEQYFILQKIEKVKEWLVYGELTLNEMAFKLGYSSVAHLSGQFKKITGFTPSAFKKLNDHSRRHLDHL